MNLCNRVFLPSIRFNSAVKKSKIFDELPGATTKAQTTTASGRPPLMCRNSELYAMHQRQLQLRKEQQLQKNLSSTLSGSTGILLGSSAQQSAVAINSPACSGGPLSNAGVGQVEGATDGSGFTMMSPAEMSHDFQVESPLHETKAGLSMAEDEGGGVAGGATGSSAIGETKSLLTSKGLQPSYNDLDHLFDDNLMDENSNDESVSCG